MKRVEQEVDILSLIASVDEDDPEACRKLEEVIDNKKFPKKGISLTDEEVKPDSIGLAMHKVRCGEMFVWGVSMERATEKSS